MEAVQLKAFKRALRAQQTVAIHGRGENREIIAVEKSADEMDQAGLSAEREFAILGLNRQSELLRKIQAALRRIENGTFGTCTNCEETIGRNRYSGCPLDTILYSLPRGGHAARGKTHDARPR